MPSVLLSKVDPRLLLSQALGFTVTEDPRLNKPISAIGVDPAFSAGLRLMGIRTVRELLRTKVWDLFQVPDVPLSAAQDAVDCVNDWLERHQSLNTTGEKLPRSEIRVESSFPSARATGLGQVLTPSESVDLGVSSELAVSLPLGSDGHSLPSNCTLTLEPDDVPQFPKNAFSGNTSTIEFSQEALIGPVGSAGDVSLVGIEAGILDITTLAIGPSLRELLQVPQQTYREVAALPTSILSPSVRTSNCLATAQINTLGQLLDANLERLWKLRNLGRKSLQELVKALIAFVGAGRASNPSTASGFGRSAACERTAGVPLTLRDEWATFAGTQHCHPDLDVSLLGLTDHIAKALQCAGVKALDDLLSWSLADAAKLLGDDGAEELLAAITPVAWDYRRWHGLSSQSAPGDADELSNLLEARWAACRVEALGLTSATVVALNRGEISTVAQLLEALCPLHPVLGLDLATFTEVWQRLVELELRSGDARTARQEHGNSSPSLSLDLVTTFLKEATKPRQWQVLCSRFGFEELPSDSQEATSVARVEGQTLAEVATVLGLSREGIRHIETAAERRICSAGSPFRGVIRTLSLLLREAGGILNIRDSAAELANYLQPGTFRPEPLCFLAYELSDEFKAVERGAIYSLSVAPWTDYGKVIGSARELWRRSTDNVRGENLVHELMQKLAEESPHLDESFVRACLRADGRFLEDDRRELELHRGLNALIVDVLRHLGRPVHFRDIAAELESQGWRNRPVSARSLHGRLVQHQELFVYVGPGTYGLVEWGLEDQRDWDSSRELTILEAITSYLEERGEPATVDEIIEHVQSRVRRRDFSIRLCLSRDPSFHRFARSQYGLAKWVFQP